MRDLNQQESKVLDSLVEAWNEYLRLEYEFEDEKSEFRHFIHNAQMIILARPAREEVG